MSAPIRDSSSGDYERKFQYFINFLRDKGIPWSKVELQNVIQFFMFLFFLSIADLEPHLPGFGAANLVAVQWLKPT